MDRLLRRAALTVDGRARHGLGPAGGEDRIAADVERLLADLHDAAPDNVVDDRRIDARALGQRAQHMRRQIHRVGVLVGAVAATDGGPNRIDDDGVTHEGLRKQRGETVIVRRNRTPF